MLEMGGTTAYAENRTGFHSLIMNFDHFFTLGRILGKQNHFQGAVSPHASVATGLDGKRIGRIMLLREN